MSHSLFRKGYGFSRAAMRESQQRLRLPILVAPILERSDQMGMESGRSAITHRKGYAARSEVYTMSEPEAGTS